MARRARRRGGGRRLKPVRTLSGRSTAAPAANTPQEALPAPDELTLRSRIARLAGAPWLRRSIGALSAFVVLSLTALVFLNGEPGAQMVFAVHSVSGGLLFVAVLIWLLATRLALVQSQQQAQGWKLAIDTLATGVAVFDADDRLVSCNDAYRALFPEVAPMLVRGVAYADIAAEYFALAPAEMRRGRSVEHVACKTVSLEVPACADFVLEGYVDPSEPLFAEGPFGDHTGYYTPVEGFPRFHVTCVTHRRDPIYPSTLVGPPPMEDAWLGKATERIFLPAIRMTVPEIVDYDLPVAGAFHNCVIVSIRKGFPGHAKKVMHAIWGLGMLSLSKSVVVVDEFATLSRELPEFVDGLVDVAQRGRSLGVHLVLATQRPAGVVNDAIRANTTLRLALRVADDQDSRDVVEVPDAAAIPRSRPGRAVLRSGSDAPVAVQVASCSLPPTGTERPRSWPRCRISCSRHRVPRQTRRSCSSSTGTRIRMVPPPLLARRFSRASARRRVMRTKRSRH